MRKAASAAAAAAAALAVAIASGLALRARRPPARPGPPPPAASCPLGLRPVPGDQRRWALAFDVALGRPGRGAGRTAMTLTGEWFATVSAVRPGECDVAFEVEGGRVSGAGVPAAAPGAADALARRLARRFWMTFRPDGAALRVHFPRDVDPGDRNLLQMIATGVELVRPPGAEAHWTATERDGAGLYLADYQRPSPDRIVKRKLGYVEVDGASGARGADGIRVEVEASTRTFSLDPAGAVVGVVGGDRLRIPMPMAPGSGITVAASATLAGGRATSDPALAGSLARAGDAVETSSIRTHATPPDVARARRDARLLEGRTPDALLAAARSGDDRGQLPDRLEALFRERPGTIPAATAIARGGEGSRVVASALAAAGTGPALAALGRVAHDAAVPPGARVDALTALVLVRHPSADAVRLPLGLLDDRDAAVRRAARMIAGALARAGRADHPGDAADVDAALLARWSAARATPERLDLLAALGNDAGTPVLPAIEAALGDPAPDVRAAAARALRLAAPGRADALLSRAMASDPDPRVRAAALFAAGRRDARPLLAAAVRAAADRVEYVRADAIGFLARHRDDTPEVAQALANAAAHDPRPGIRRLARAALDAPPPAAGAAPEPPGAPLRPGAPSAAP